jgi:hypothetical protein
MLAVASDAAAQTTDPRTWMSRDEIISAFVGQQLAGVYPRGTAWKERIRPDGTSDYREGGARRDGRWWLRGDHFCFSYALPMSGGCFQVVTVGRNCYELYAVGIGGGAEPSPPIAQNFWNGRMWREDLPATCEEEPLVGMPMPAAMS